MPSSLSARLRRHADVHDHHRPHPHPLRHRLLYFGIHPTGWLTTAFFFGALSVPLLATLRERQGLAIALDYLLRVYLRDPSDEIHGGRAVARSL